MVQRALPLGENLQRRGITSDVSCPHCKATETSIHTFFLCPFAQKVWEKIPLHHTVHIAADDTIETILSKFRNTICLPPSGVSSPIFPWTLGKRVEYGSSKGTKAEHHVPWTNNATRTRTSEVSTTPPRYDHLQDRRIVGQNNKESRTSLDLFRKRREHHTTRH